MFRWVSKSKLSNWHNSQYEFHLGFFSCGFKYHLLFNGLGSWLLICGARLSLTENYSILEKVGEGRGRVTFWAKNSFEKNEKGKKEIIWITVRQMYCSFTANAVSL